MSPSYLLFVFISLCAISIVTGDFYMQNLRGSNDRLNEEGDRQNAQRLFDSENNARGGYCWGPELTFYEGSVLSIEWTSQHACGNENTQCNIVLQYMCTSDAPGDDETKIIRDGTTTDTIGTSTDPNSAQYYNKKDANGVFVFGMNEDYQNYRSCLLRERNKGLFTGEEAVSNGQGAMATRQNANGQRHGFECSEERDYYPYWHPSPWKDIAVMVPNKAECAYYQAESQNVKPKNYCNYTGNGNAGSVPNNQNDCVRATGVWAEKAAFGIGKPACVEAAFSRDNHLGNGIDGHTNGFNWTIPRDEDCITNGNCTCVVRLRYNITVGELTGTEDSLQSGVNSPVEDDPTVAVEGANYTLALDTAQTGRGFQDRSFMFRIAPRPAGVSGTAKIYNLNVRGKKGNIVQAYPATEYDFVPTFLEVEKDDFVHFQWTGCDTNPANNQGEGRQKTDRSNIVQISDMSKNYPMNDTELATSNLLFKDPAVRARFANIDQTNCLSYAALKAAAAAGGPAVDQNPQNCMVLNAAPTPRFTGGLVRMSDTGTYNYMSTRNNNFSNRSQKASITVTTGWPAWKTAVIVVGGVVAVAVGAAAGSIFYAKLHPLSKVAEIVHKIPGFSKI